MYDLYRWTRKYAITNRLSDSSVITTGKSIKEIISGEVNVLATKLAGKSARLTVVDDENNELFKKDISISGMNYFETVKFSIQAGEKGVYRYQLHLTELDGEITYKNNYFFFFI